jgi:hypothetical protein
MTLWVVENSWTGAQPINITYVIDVSGSAEQGDHASSQRRSSGKISGMAAPDPLHSGAFVAEIIMADVGVHLMEVLLNGTQVSPHVYVSMLHVRVCAFVYVCMYVCACVYMWLNARK